jgi:hypothetical protein
MSNKLAIKTVRVMLLTLVIGGIGVIILNQYPTQAKGKKPIVCCRFDQLAISYNK